MFLINVKTIIDVSMTWETEWYILRKNIFKRILFMFVFWNRNGIFWIRRIEFASEFLGKLLKTICPTVPGIVGGS